MMDEEEAAQVSESTPLYRGGNKNSPQMAPHSNTTRLPTLKFSNNTMIMPPSNFKDAINPSTR